MILSCGEALIDMVPILGSDGKTTYAPFSGGEILTQLLLWVD